MRGVHVRKLLFLSLGLALTFVFAQPAGATSITVGTAAGFYLLDDAGLPVSGSGGANSVTSPGATTSAVGSAPLDGITSATASAEFGSNHASAFSAAPAGGVGTTAYAASYWGDFFTLSCNPVAFVDSGVSYCGPVFLNFHLDGTLKDANGSDVYFVDPANGPTLDYKDQLTGAGVASLRFRSFGAVAETDPLDLNTLDLSSTTSPTGGYDLGGVYTTFNIGGQNVSICFPTQGLSVKPLNCETVGIGIQYLQAGVPLPVGFLLETMVTAGGTADFSATATLDSVRVPDGVSVSVASGDNYFQVIHDSSLDPALTADPAAPSAVPEPGSLVLLATGLGVIARRMRRLSPDRERHDG